MTPTVNNPLEPPMRRTLEVEEVWRLGTDNDEDYVFGVIKDVLQDEQENFYLLDYQLNEVFKFSPAGNYLKSISRQGEGPGEISGCNQFFFWNAGTIACFDFFSNNFVCFDLEGIPKTNIYPKSIDGNDESQRPTLNGFEKRDGFFVSSGYRFLYEDEVNRVIKFLSVFDSEAKEIFVFNKLQTNTDFSKPIIVDEEDRFNAFDRWCLGQNGEVYIAPDRQKYWLDVYDTQGNLLRQIKRQWPVHKRTQEEKEAAKNRFAFGGDGPLPHISFKISNYPMAINNLFWLDNKLWVTTISSPNRPNPENRFVYDIFDSQGNYLEERTYNLPVNPDEDRIHMLGNGLIVVVTNIRSALISSRDSSFKIQVGEGEEAELPDEDVALEVILYRVVGLQE